MDCKPQLPLQQQQQHRQMMSPRGQHPNCPQQAAQVMTGQHLSSQSNPAGAYLANQRDTKPAMTSQTSTNQSQEQVQYLTTPSHTSHHQFRPDQNLQQHQHSYTHQQQQQQQVYQTRPLGGQQLEMSPHSVNAPPTPPSEEHPYHPQSSMQQRPVYLSPQNPMQGAGSRAQTGEWVMQTIQQQQQQQPHIIKQQQQQVEYGPQGAIASYYYDIDDGFSDIMSAPATPEPMAVYDQGQHYTAYPAYATGEHHHNSNHHAHQQHQTMGEGVHAIEHHQPGQQQQQFLNQHHHHHQNQSYQQQQHNPVEAGTNQMLQANSPIVVPYAAAMSPDSSSLSTTSSSPSDHSLYQASPPMPTSCVLATRYSPAYAAKLESPVFAPAHQQQQQTPVGATTTTTTNGEAPVPVVLKPIGGQQIRQAQQVQPNNHHPHHHHHHRSSPIHLWEFLKELLQQVESGCADATIIRWLDRQKGVFKIEDSVRVAKLWGKRKNKPKMNYDKLSRSIRQYYKKGIMKKTDRSQRLVYQFCSAYCH